MRSRDPATTRAKVLSLAAKTRRALEENEPDLAANVTFTTRDWNRILEARGWPVHRPCSLGERCTAVGSWKSAAHAVSMLAAVKDGANYGGERCPPFSSLGTAFPSWIFFC
jgi:hypothetical protein